MSYKDLYQEIIRTQQDIAVTYQRLVAVENELKRNIHKSSTLPTNLSDKLDVLQKKVDLLLNQLLVEPVDKHNTVTTANEKTYEFEAVLNDIKKETNELEMIAEETIEVVNLN